MSETGQNCAYAESPGRYRTQADAYLVARKGYTPKEAALRFAADRPDFEGDVVVMNVVIMRPAPGIERPVVREHIYKIKNGKATRRKKA